MSKFDTSKELVFANYSIQRSVERLIECAGSCKTPEEIKEFEKVANKCILKGISLSSGFKGENALSEAAQNGCPHAVAWLLAHGVSPNLIIPENGNNALMCIVEWGAGQEECVDLLLSKIDVHARNHDGNTALHTMIEGSRICMKAYAQKLIDAGLDVNARNKKGQTALHMLCSFLFRGGSTPEFVPFVQMLLNSNADPNIPDGSGNTPLMLACVNLNLECVRSLLDKGVDINARNNDGSTALLKALYSPWGDCENCARLLVSRGANISVSCLQAAFDKCKSLYDEWTAPEIITKPALFENVDDNC